MYTDTHAMSQHTPMARLNVPMAHVHSISLGMLCRSRVRMSYVSQDLMNPITLSRSLAQLQALYKGEVTWLDLSHAIGTGQSQSIATSGGTATASADQRKSARVCASVCLRL